MNDPSSIAPDGGTTLTTAQALRIEEARSHRILSDIAQGFMFLDAGYRVRQINDEGVRIDGRPAAELIGRTHWELWPGTQLLPIGEAYRRVMAERRAVSVEQCYSHVGRNTWFDVQCYPVDDGIAVFYRNISKRKRAEQALSEREQQLRLAIDAADVGEWDVDMKSGAMFWPAPVKAMFGISADRAVTLDDYYDGVHPDDRARTLASFAATADPALRSQYVAEYRTIGKEDGVIRWVAAKGRGLFNEANECIRVIGTAIDITQRKAIEEALRESEERLRQADRRKDEFLAMLAHELRNPLAPIRAAADLLQIVKLDQQRVHQTSQIIARQVSHMTGLVDDLLDVSRVTSGLVELDLAPLDMYQVITEAIEQVAPLVRARGHTLASQMSPGDMLLMGDRKRLVQVMVNLLNNAAKYTQEGGHIVVRGEAAGTDVVVEVIDNGVGMGAELMGRAFEPFAQAERSSDRSSGGLGLGLALVRSITGLHGGTAICASLGSGQGSTFTVRLPRLPGSTAADTAPPLRASAHRGSRGTLNILLVDDNEDAASMLGMLLEASGYTVAVEHSARAALARSAVDAPDVFLLDIGLPEMSGNELARRLRAQPHTAHAVLIAVTGYGQDQDRAQTAAAGFDHHLVKPVDFQALSDILAALVPGAAAGVSTASSG